MKEIILNEIDYDENSGVEILDKIVANTDREETLIEIANHKNVSSEILDKIVYRAFQIAYNNPDRILESVVWNKNVSSKTLNKIMKIATDKDILNSIATHENATDKIKYKALKKIERVPDYESMKFFLFIIPITFGFLYHIVEIANFVSNNLIESGLAVLFAFFIVFC